ncbi:MAG: carboxypeptidase-like regulatory domain-containing protein [bacterium]|jgi:hypothetical protein
MKKIILSVFFLALVSSCALFEKKQLISGTVVSKSTNQPMEAVKVYIKNTEVSTLTDSTGLYTLCYKNLSGFQLVFQHKGYKTTRVDIVEDKDKTRYEINVALQRNN